MKRKKRRVWEEKWPEGSAQHSSFGEWERRGPDAVTIYDPFKELTGGRMLTPTNVFGSAYTVAGLPAFLLTDMADGEVEWNEVPTTMIGGGVVKLEEIWQASQGNFIRKQVVIALSPRTGDELMAHAVAHAHKPREAAVVIHAFDHPDMHFAWELASYIEAFPVRRALGLIQARED